MCHVCGREQLFGQPRPNFSQRRGPIAQGIVASELGVLPKARSAPVPGRSNNKNPCQRRQVSSATIPAVIIHHSSFLILPSTAVRPNRKLSPPEYANPLAPATRLCFTGPVSVDLGIWSKLTQIAVGLVVVAILLLIFVCYKPLIDENERMRRQILKLDAEIKTQEMISADLTNQINVLRNDPKTVERLTREKLGYARPDETVIYFKAPVTNPPAGQ